MLLLVVASLSLLTPSQAKTLLIQTADRADKAEDVSENVSADVAAEEGSEAATPGDYGIVMDGVMAGFDWLGRFMNPRKRWSPKGGLPTSVTTKKPHYKGPIIEHEWGYWMREQKKPAWLTQDKKKKCIGTRPCSLRKIYNK